MQPIDGSSSKQQADRTPLQSYGSGQHPDGFPIELERYLSVGVQPHPGPQRMPDSLGPRKARSQHVQVADASQIAVK